VAEFYLIPGAYPLVVAVVELQVVYKFDLAMVVHRVVKVAMGQIETLYLWLLAAHSNEDFEDVAV